MKFIFYLNTISKNESKFLMSEQHEQHEQHEISLVDIVKFFGEHYKRILMCGVVGLVVAIAAYTQSSIYQATSILTNDGTVDFVLLKRLQINLPRIAQQIADSNGSELANELSSESWWTKNFKPTFAITKADQKDVTDLASGNNKILNFVFSASSKTEEVALKKANESADFFKNAAALIMAKDLLQSYNHQVENGMSQLEKSRLEIKSEIEYLTKKAKNLEELKARFPQNQTVFSSQVLDPKDSGSKYLPISTQLIAVYEEIAMKQEALEKIKDAEILLSVKDRASDLLENSLKNRFDGLGVLNEVTDDMKIALSSTNDPKTLLALQTVTSEIMAVQSQYRSGLGQRTPTQVTKKSISIFLMIGLFAGLFLGLIYASFLSLMNRYKEGKNLGVIQ
jgi:hypothetical protein